MSHGYAVTNVLQGLAAASFTWSSGYVLNRNRLNDGTIDELAQGSATAQASGQTLTIDLGAAVALTGIAILNHNLGVGACTVKVDAGDDLAITVNPVAAKAASTINTAIPLNKDTMLQFPSVTKRYWRLTFTHSGTKIITLGCLFAVGTTNLLSRPTMYGYNETLKYFINEVSTKTMHQRATFVGGPNRTKHLLFGELQGSTQRDELMGMFHATLGGTLNLLWIDFIESTAIAATGPAMELLYGGIEPSMGWTNSDFSVYTVDGFKLIGQGREVGS